MPAMPGDASCTSGTAFKKKKAISYAGVLTGSIHAITSRLSTLYMPALDSSSSHGSAWTYPSAALLVPPIVLTLQSALLFIRPSPPSSSPSSSPSSLASSSAFRLALLPVSLYAIWHSCSIYEGSFFHPVRDFIHLNTVIQLAKFWACMRSVEFAVSDTRDYRWVGYEEAYHTGDNRKQPSNRQSKTNHGSKRHRGDTAANASTHSSKQDADMPDADDTDTRNPLLLGWLNLCSLRGIGWHWGIKGTSIPPPHPADHLVLSLLLRIIWSHVLTVLAVSFVVYHRQQSPLHSEVLRTFFPSLPKHNALVDTASRLTQVAFFGLVVYTTLECGYSLLTLAVYFLTNFSRWVIPSRGPLAAFRPDPFNRRAWPRLSNKPVYSDSLADFWGRRWHSLFRRIFVAVGGRPLSALPEKLGLRNCGKGIKLALATSGAFMTSGVLHECFNEATPWLPRDTHYTVFIFFTLQAFGMVLERSISRLLLGGLQRKSSKIFGRVFCWAFLLSTGLLMTECWVDRGIVDNQPPIVEWKWWRWCIPLSFVIPDLTTTRLHQLMHLK